MGEDVQGKESSIRLRIRNNRLLPHQYRQTLIEIYCCGEGVDGVGFGYVRAVVREEGVVC